MSPFEFRDGTSGHSRSLRIEPFDNFAKDHMATSFMGQPMSISWKVAGVRRGIEPFQGPTNDRAHNAISTRTDDKNGIDYFFRVDMCGICLVEKPKDNLKETTPGLSNERTVNLAGALQRNAVEKPEPGEQEG